MVQEAPPEVKAAYKVAKTENVSWYLMKRLDEKFNARLDGEFSAEDLRIIADRIDTENKK